MRSVDRPHLDPSGLNEVCSERINLVDAFCTNIKQLSIKITAGTDWLIDSCVILVQRASTQPVYRVPFVSFIYMKSTLACCSSDKYINIWHAALPLDIWRGNGPRAACEQMACCSPLFTSLFTILIGWHQTSFALIIQTFRAHKF